ncbi:hypothetical protein ACWD0J_07260 [Streptomyces sp. NPDC003011]
MLPNCSARDAMHVPGPLTDTDTAMRDRMLGVSRVIDVRGHAPGVLNNLR